MECRARSGIVAWELNAVGLKMSDCEDLDMLSDEDRG